MNITLDILSEKKVDELAILYSKGTLPENFSKLDGKPKGRMLSINCMDKAPLFQLISRFSMSSIFPWKGKNFKSESYMTGTGINRINILNLIKTDWFPFETRIEPSVIDGCDCIYLDYDLPGNPWFIRKIRDELRQIAPKLFLGPAMWKDNQGGASLLLWFGIDSEN